MARADQVIDTVMLGKLDFLDVVYNNLYQCYVFRAIPFQTRPYSSPLQKTNETKFGIASKAYSNITRSQVDFLKSICFSSNLSYRDFFIKMYMNSLLFGKSSIIDVKFDSTYIDGPNFCYVTSHDNFNGNVYILFSPGKKYYYSCFWGLKSILFRGKTFRRKMRLYINHKYLMSNYDGSLGHGSDCVPMPCPPPFSYFAFAISSDDSHIGFGSGGLIDAP